MTIKAVVLTISDGCFRGEREDVSGVVATDILRENGYEMIEHGLLPDEAEEIADKLRTLLPLCDLIITTGGTGFAPRDVTPEAARTVIERDAPGLAELLRWTGYQKLPRAVLSRGVAGIAGETLIITLPGSTGGVRDGLEVLLPLLPHAIALMKDRPVDHTPSPNALSSEEKADTKAKGDHTPRTVSVLETNVDDLSPEFYEPLMERLFAAGALDVFFAPVQMKKNRPAVIVTVLCTPGLRETMAEILFLETSTFGVRHTTWERFTLEREMHVVSTEYGDIRVKVGKWKGKEVAFSPEYEDVKAAARAHGLSPQIVYRACFKDAPYRP